MMAIQIENLTKKFKDIIAVNDLNINIEEGELFGLLGVNGAGKTTTIKMLCCLTQPDKGDAKIGGYSVLRQRDKVKEVIGLSTQETAVAKNLTVKENLEFYGSIYNIGKCLLNERVQDLLKRFNLLQFENKKAGKLSGGYMRKLSIAMALISNPKVLFLDEPTLGLDVISKHDLWEIIKEIKRNTTIILTTHYLEEAESLCDRIGIMVGGRLIEVGTVKDLKEKANEDNFENAFIKLVKGAE